MRKNSKTILASTWKSWAMFQHLSTKTQSHKTSHSQLNKPSSHQNPSRNLSSLQLFNPHFANSPSIARKKRRSISKKKLSSQPKLKLLQVFQVLLFRKRSLLSKLVLHRVNKNKKSKPKRLLSLLYQSKFSPKSDQPVRERHLSLQNQS